MTLPQPSPSSIAAEAVETILVREHRVACDGGGGALGHPRIYLEMGAKGSVECPYCGRLYVMDGGASH